MCGAQCSVRSFLNGAHHVQVTDAKGHTLFQKEDASKGKFAVTTEAYDVFEVCVMSTITSKQYSSYWIQAYINHLS